MGDYTREFVFEDQILHVRLSGNLPDEIFHRKGNVFQPIIEACFANECSKALIDVRDLKVNLDTFQIYDVGEDAVILNQLSLRVALLARDGMIDPFFEDVVNNRDGKIGVFTDRLVALVWLER